jgi:hypothetical protein
MPNFFIHNITDKLDVPIFLYFVFLGILLFHVKYVKVPEQPSLRHLIIELNKINKSNNQILKELKSK